MFALAGECAWFEAARSYVDGGESDGVQQVLVQTGQLRGWGLIHNCGEHEHPTSGIQETDLGRFQMVFFCGLHDEAAHELVCQYVGQKLLLYIVDGLAAQHVRKRSRTPTCI